MSKLQTRKVMNQAFRNALYEAKPDDFAGNYETERYPFLSIEFKVIYNCYKVRKTLWERQKEQPLPDWKFVCPNTEDYSLVAVFWNKRKPSVGGVLAIQLHPAASPIITVFAGQHCRPWGWMPLYVSEIVENEELESLLEALFLSLRFYGQNQLLVKCNAVKAV